MEDGSRNFPRLADPLPTPAWLEAPDEEEPKRKLRFRTVFISDTHLGTSGCNAELLFDFLKSIECETLYLVGDIIDGWRLKRGWFWPTRHNDVVRRILKMAKKGTRVVYVPGNHDEVLRDFIGLGFGDIEIRPEAIHITADGRKLLVLHGDEFDGVVLYHRWLAFLGDHAYVALLKLNVGFNWCRRQFDLPYWSLSAHLKKRVKNAVEYVCRYEEAVAHAARDRGADGVVCGHIHSAEIRQFGDITYYNDGDWVESCTALVEHDDGRMEILDWAEKVRAEIAAGQPVKARKSRGALVPVG
ncbi:UDP-2,3-diacylglucosamine diphosphatase [Sandaracinobacter sp. RS1-74]|uniref:UDP-2,3-diacylglucosamine diphosphatase n=1 Tax=Sandaracinobacteroides sayramensis TaxID=2913411 RepID=UPI001EDC63EA|nr:UDP-2,3-diacylglucosamine diphosphatase [Sandaracinobacteroides sayramensis]MCG2840450.1 UDP-2,3-diacylglucosamine diphosphatase [Sandaracinobacteroides sayramensis]